MSKNFKTPLITLVLIICLVLSLFPGCAFSAETISKPGNTEIEADSELGLEVVEQAWKIIFEDYVDREKLDPGKLSQAAIEGMLEALNDPYSSYLSKAGYQASIEGLEGKFEGIGAYVGMRDEHIMIIAPILDSPADKAGIKSGDIILGIDGDSTEGLSLNEAILRIRGPKGTPVRLLILHEGEIEPVEIEIIRDEIQLSSIFFEMKEDIAYIAIMHFTERTNDELKPVLAKMAQEGAASIILDLRSNPGGLLEAVIDVASRFLDDGVVLYVVDNEDRKMTHSINTNVENTGLPMVVLTDNYTASASEVLAGALQDHNRAVIAGTKTYGKGSVNLLHPLKDNSGLYLTYARWYTPDGHLIEGKGITPDFEFELEGDDAVQWAIDYLKDNK